jgi:hypothetical protein
MDVRLMLLVYKKLLLSLAQEDTVDRETPCLRSRYAVKGTVFSVICAAHINQLTNYVTSVVNTHLWHNLPFIDSGPNNFFDLLCHLAGCGPHVGIRMPASTDEV